MARFSMKPLARMHVLYQVGIGVRRAVGAVTVPGDLKEPGVVVAAVIGANVIMKVGSWLGPC